MTPSTLLESPRVHHHPKIPSYHTASPFPQLDKSLLPLPIHPLDLLHPGHEPTVVPANHIDQLPKGSDERVLDFDQQQASLRA